MTAEQAIEKLDVWSTYFDVEINCAAADGWTVEITINGFMDAEWTTGKIYENLIDAVKEIDDKIKADLGY